jgi:hypothetical protein
MADRVSVRDSLYGRANATRSLAEWTAYFEDQVTQSASAPWQAQRNGRDVSVPAAHQRVDVPQLKRAAAVPGMQAAGMRETRRGSF